MKALGLPFHSIFVLALLAGASLLGDDQPWLNLLSTSDHFRVHYTTDCSAAPAGSDCGAVTSIAAMTDFIANVLEPARGDLVDMGFIEIAPVADIYVHGESNSDNSSLMHMSAEVINSMDRASVVHELFHSTQFSYPSSQPRWVLEGQAEVMMTKIYQDLYDLSHGEGCITTYFSQAYYDSSIPGGNILYATCPFWYYLVNRLGGQEAAFADPTSSRYGLDALSRFWELGVSGVQGLDTVQILLDEAEPGTSVQEFFRGFTVANYAKDLSGSGVPSIYNYIENEHLRARARGGCGAECPQDCPEDCAPVGIPRVLQRELAPNEVASGTDFVRSWSAKYFEVHLTGDPDIVSLNFEQLAENTVSYTVLFLSGAPAGVPSTPPPWGWDLVDSEVFTGRDLVRAYPVEGFDKVAVVVTGLENAAGASANFRYTISAPSGGPGGMGFNILQPTQGNPARVGAAASPGKAMVVVDVVDAGGDPVLGLVASDFTVRIGGVEAEKTGTYVASQVWMLVDAPAQSADGTYDLEVTLASLVDLEPQSVEYGTRNTDTVIVMDGSGSMNDRGKLDAAKTAAALFVNSFANEDQAGLVQFESNASVLRALDDLASIRAVLLSLIEGMAADGPTSIGDGLTSAREDLNARASSDHDWFIVLLSDGIENREEWLFRPRGEGAVDLLKANETAIPVHVVAFGSDADLAALEEVAQQTRGSLLFAPEVTDGTLTNALSASYRSIAEDMRTEERAFSLHGLYDRNRPRVHRVAVEAGASEMTVAVNFTGTGDAPQVKLLRPGGVEAFPTFERSRLTATERHGHVFYRVRRPPAGEWEISLTCGQGVEFCTGRYFTDLAVTSEVALRVLFRTRAKQGLLVGEPVTISALLLGGIPITGAEVVALITPPSSLEAAQPQVISLALHDDGLHEDGEAADGVYGNTFTQTSEEGLYRVEVEADGTTQATGPFHRERSGAFVLRPSPNLSGDGLPDSWKSAHGLDPKTPSADDDPDLDGLSNGKEYRAGTHPRNADTDGGGEGDGSEIAAGGNPFDPKDDAIGPIRDFWVEPLAEACRIIFSPDARLDHLELYRAEGEAEGFVLVAANIAAKGAYVDGKLKNDATYFYRLVPVNAKGRKGAPSRAIPASPGTDRELPDGLVEINEGAEVTDSPQVTLKILASSDTTEMAISNDVFSPTGWQPYQETLSWTLAGLGPQAVFVVLRDAAGNRSIDERHLTDQILVKPEVGGDGFRRGDSNSDGLVDISDAVRTLGHLFLGDEGFLCADAADSNDDGDLDLSDGIATLAWLFTGGSEPPPPGPRSCRPDPSEDRLIECAYPEALCAIPGRG